MKFAICLVLFLAPSAFAGEPVYSWRSNAEDPDRVYLYLDGKQIGGWCYRAKHYRSLEGDTWGKPVAAPPASPPGESRAVRPTVPLAVAPSRKPLPAPSSFGLNLPRGRPVASRVASIFALATERVVQEMLNAPVIQLSLDKAPKDAAQK